MNTEYRNKADAKAAVACLAAEQGLVDLLRFRGGPLPSDYTPFWEAQVNGNGDHYVTKRKDRDRDWEEGQDRKRRKGNFRDGAGGFSSSFRSKVKIEPPSDGTLLYRKHYLSQPPTGPSAKNSWRKLRLTGSSSFGGADTSIPESCALGKDQSEHKNASVSNKPNSRDQIAHPPTAPRGFFAKVNPHRNHGDQGVYATNHQSQTSHPYPPPYSAPTTPLQSRSDHYSQFELQTQPEPYVQSNSYHHADSHVQPTTYPSPVSYQLDSYAQRGSYGPSYSAYPPTVLGSVAYVNPPPVVPASHPYVYYSPPAPPLPISTLVPYGHYVQPSQYPAQYSNGHYVSYHPPPPAHHQMYNSSHPPSSVTMPPTYPPTPLSNASASPSRYPPRFRSSCSPPYSPHHDALFQPPGSLSPQGNQCSSFSHNYPANYQQHIIDTQSGSQHQWNDYQSGKSREVRSKQGRTSVGTFSPLRSRRK